MRTPAHFKSRLILAQKTLDRSSLRLLEGPAQPIANVASLVIVETTHAVAFVQVVDCNRIVTSSRYTADSTY